MKKTITLILCLCMVLALLVGCGSKTEKAPDAKPDANKTDIPEVQVGGGGASGGNAIIEADAYKDVFRIGGQMEFPSLDFHESLNAYYVVTLTHDTLVTYDNGEYIPALATEWKRIDSLTWEFTLRDGVTFQDGSPFVAEDVVFTIKRGLDNPNSAVRSRLSCVEDVVAVDDHTVKFTLNSPNQDFLLCMQICCPRSVSTAYWRRKTSSASLLPLPMKRASTSC